MDTLITRNMETRNRFSDGHCPPQNRDGNQNLISNKSRPDTANPSAYQNTPRGQALVSSPGLQETNPIHPSPRGVSVDIGSHPRRRAKRSRPLKTLASLFLITFIGAAVADEKPLVLHPENPHYFLFRGKPTLLITSAEHYGAVLNRDFDFIKYLDELHAHQFNLTRVFSGVYCEDSSAFNITRNTLAPEQGKFLSPWTRSNTPGYAGGGNLFDLAKWNDAFFERLKTFLREAGQRGIVVEFNLFCPFYNDSMWKLSPMNAANNVNGIGKIALDAPYNRDKNGPLQAIQETLTRKFVTELNGFDNLYYEICNEPYFGGVTDDWQRRIIDVIVETEKSLRNRHLISLNIANGTMKIANPHPAVSIFNFHYASPPTAVTDNFGLDKVIGENETGFKGTGDTHYRMEAWEFLLAGGGLYNNLDYSFAVGHEDGTFAYPEKTPGGGNVGFRKQIGFLKAFLGGFEFARMKPDTEVVKGGLNGDGKARVLSEPGRQYAAYFFGGHGAKPSLALPAGQYQVDWFRPTTGEKVKSEVVTATGPPIAISSPPFDPDIALRILRVKGS